MDGFSEKTSVQAGSRQVPVDRPLETSRRCISRIMKRRTAVFLRENPGLIFTFHKPRRNRCLPAAMAFHSTQRASISAARTAAPALWLQRHGRPTRSAPKPLSIEASDRAVSDPVGRW